MQLILMLGAALFSFLIQVARVDTKYPFVPLRIIGPWCPIEIPIAGSLAHAQFVSIRIGIVDLAKEITSSNFYQAQSSILGSWFTNLPMQSHCLK